MLMGSSYRKLRQEIIDSVYELVKLPDNVFPDATVETILIFCQKGAESQSVRSSIYHRLETVVDIETSRYDQRSKAPWKDDAANNFNIYVSDEEAAVLHQIDQAVSTLGKISDFSLGLTPYDKYQGHDEETITSRAFHSDTKLTDDHQPLASGANIRRYMMSTDVNEYIRYGPWLGAMREERFFKDLRVVVRQIASGTPPSIYASITDAEIYISQIGFAIVPHDRQNSYAIGCILNSTLANFYHRHRFLDPEKYTFQKVLIQNIKQIPIPADHIGSIAWKLVAENRIASDLVVVEVIQTFLRLLQRRFPLDTLSRKLEDWPSLDFSTFVEEVNKGLKKGKHEPLSLSQELEWEPLFESKRAEVLALQAEITRLDREIDVAVYRLYRLSWEEVLVVDAGVQGWMGEGEYIAN